MQINHVALYVNDADESLKLYRDLLGFEPMPGWDQVFPNDNMTQELLDDCFNTTGARIRDVFMRSPGGQKLELVQPLSPDPDRTAHDKLGYPSTGIRELAFDVVDIDDWFTKIQEAGYQTLTDYVWEITGALRSFLFRDADGNVIQFVEETAAPAA